MLLGDLLLSLVVSVTSAVAIFSPGQMGHFAFSRVFKNSVFGEGKIVTTAVRSLVSCANYCCLFENCDGVNFQKTVHSSSRLHHCELVNFPSSPSGVLSVPKLGWSAYTISRTPVEKVMEHTSGTGSWTVSSTEPWVVQRETNRNTSTVSKTAPETTTISRTTQQVMDDSINSTPNQLAFENISSISTSTGATDIYTTGGWVDTNPEYCTIDGAFVLNTKIYLISGEAIYTYNSEADLATGPTQGQRLGSVLIGLSANIDAIFTDGTNLYVCKGGMVQTFVDSAGTGNFEWILQESVSDGTTFGETFGNIKAVFIRASETVVIDGDKVTGLSSSKTCKVASSCGGNALLATNARDAPDPITAACAMSDEILLLFSNNICYRYNRVDGDRKGTWSVQGAVKCR